MLLFRHHDLQIFGFTPGKRIARMNGWGLEWRYRRWPNGKPDVGRGAHQISKKVTLGSRAFQPVWHHHKIILWNTVRDDLRRGKGAINVFEYNQWLTSPGVSRERITMKAGFRFKVMRGGQRFETNQDRRRRKRHEASRTFTSDPTD